MWRLVTDKSRRTPTALPFLPKCVQGKFRIKGFFGLATGIQCFLISQAISAGGEAPILNAEHLMNTVVSVTVFVVSVCNALLAPNAASAAGTLVALEFIAMFDDHFVHHMAAYLVPEDFQRIKPRPLFYEDYWAVGLEIVFLVAAFSAVMNCVIGLTTT
jgi:hypothetical protein